MIAELIVDLHQLSPPELHACWRRVGRIDLTEGALRIDSNCLPDEPGLYRLCFGDDTFYIGEAGDIRRRVGDYLRYYRGTGVENEFRINGALQKACGADIDIIRGANLQSRSQRCTLENRLIKYAKESLAAKMLNGGSLEERIAFHQAEVLRLQDKLSKQKAASEGAITT
jgi:uncharacterized small protein (DUF1192 family)